MIIIKTIRLNELVSFVQGVNPTRMESKKEYKNISYYDKEAFEEDSKYQNIENDVNVKRENDLAVYEGDVIISNFLHLATIVSKESSGKIPSLNFTKVIFLDDQIDKNYFVYLFNENQSVKIQKEREAQGKVNQRLSVKALGDLIVPIIPLDHQIILGDIYLKKEQLKNDLNIYAKLVDELVSAYLEENTNLNLNEKGVDNNE